jgi:hypothetical protein
MVPQELDAIRNGTFDKIMQKTAEGKHSEKQDYPEPSNAFS